MTQLSTSMFILELKTSPWSYRLDDGGLDSKSMIGASESYCSQNTTAYIYEIEPYLLRLD